MSEFFDILRPIELNEIIDIFKKDIVNESKTTNNCNSYIKLINFIYPKYFVNKFGSKAISEKIYEYILMNTSRRYLVRDFIEIKDNDGNNDNENVDTLINYIIFYKYINKVNENTTKYYITSNLNDNICGILFPVLNRNYCSNAKINIPILQEIKEYYDNGKLKIEGNCINGKVNGIYKEYYDTGQLKIEGNYIDDKREGIYKGYYDNGQLKIEGNYIDGKFNGIYKEYYDNGQLKIEATCIDGKFNGIYKEYYDNGQLKIETNYIDGKIKKIYKEYYDTGQLKIEKWY